MRSTHTIICLFITIALCSVQRVAGGRSISISLRSLGRPRDKTVMPSVHAAKVPVATAQNLVLFDNEDYFNCSCTALADCQGNLTAALDSRSPDSDTEDPCASAQPDPYSTGYHVGGIFVILCCSLLGAGLPLFSKYAPGAQIPPFALILGKCAGTGVVLACGLIHMLQPGNESLTNACLSTAFTEDYPAYAFLFAIIGAFLMQLIDFVAETYLLRYIQRSQIQEATAIVQAEDQQDTETLKSPTPSQVGTSKAALVEMTSQATRNADNSGAQATEADPVAKNPALNQLTDQMPSSSTLHLADTLATPRFNSPATRVPCGHEGHVHSILLTKQVRATLSAYLLEFGITVHSVFIGIEVGVANDDEMRVLLVALAFHQFFEGIALGTRLIDAELPSHWHELILALIFSISCPIGMMIGVVITTSLNPSGPTFLITQGTFDGICAGILIYIGFILMIRDFPQDMREHCDGKQVKESESAFRKGSMFAALWMGAGLMAFLGRYV